MKKAQCDAFLRRQKVRLSPLKSLGTDFLSKKRHCFSTILTLELKSLLEEEDIKEEKQRRCEGLSGAELLFQAVVVWYYMTRQGVCEQNSKSK